MTDLWAPKREAARQRVEPLAVRMRPRTMDEFVGQQHILGPGRLLRRMIEADAITSIILHGPPGTGKTTLARVIAAQTRRRFVAENAAGVGVKRIREVIDEATRAVELEGRRTILFLDEIHRFTRSQQDVLLNDVERGLVTLIGATTENPLFACNSALVSRSTLFRLEPLSEDEVADVVRRAIADPERGYGRLDLRVADDAIRVWAVKSDGDARRALNALEVAVLSQQNRARSASECQSTQPDGARSASECQPSISIDRPIAEDSIQQKAAVYDGTGDEHYDAISAMIKSIRGSDPDAAVYWVARMLDAGEDPRFIARRLGILASEDIGNADPHAMPLAAACWHLVERVGMPECRLTLSQCAIYLALAPKSNASCAAIDEAMADVREGRTVPVPLYLRDPNSSPIGEGVKMRDRTGEKYEYSHNAPGAFTGQDYLGVEKRYYRPTARGDEKRLGERLAELRRLREHIRGTTPQGEP
ncbi:MAG TPA: replication-associated recombination protein A [Phycisphaerales bacterium]|nr:replication-associated recombination protein A [Phycisphaerales bacterium]